jgi:endonuclease/exonuclease/phosphatase family metal-dependent hydrolase
MLKVEKPAVMGGQEVTSVQLSYIASFGYGAYGAGRADGGVTENSGEMMGIFYDESQVTMEGNGTFWLNEDGIVGEKGWDAGYVRIASWARFSLAGKPYKKFIVLNTHLDNDSAESRKQSIIKIKNKLKEINPNNLPVVLLGDFNIVATDRIFDVLKPDFVDTRAVAPETDSNPTYTKWGEEGFAGRVIDHIFASGFDILKYRTVNDRTYIGKGTFLGFPFDEKCPYLSDHDPITAILEF